MLNSPIFVTLSGLVYDCYIFSVNRPIPLYYMNSYDPVDKKQDNVEVNMLFNNYNYKSMDSNQHQVSIKDLVHGCPLGK